MSLIRKMKIKTMVKYHLSPNTLTKTEKLEYVLFFCEALTEQLIHQQLMQNVM